VVAGGELPAAKYLSSPKLMRLQLQDATFRRHFLVQVWSACSAVSIWVHWTGSHCCTWQ
jgi:THO complex subunit 1 transcription elongation factor